MVKKTWEIWTNSLLPKSHYISKKSLYISATLTQLNISLSFSAAAAAAKSRQSCPTLSDPMDGSPPGSPIPWDSPGKNTGVGCHFLLQCMKVKSESESEVVSDS